jgi:hypothetical protein
VTFSFLRFPEGLLLPLDSIFLGWSFLRLESLDNAGVVVTFIRQEVGEVGQAHRQERGVPRRGVAFQSVPAGTRRTGSMTAGPYPVRRGGPLPVTA